MGTLTGANLLSRVEDILQDASNVRWSEAELLRYINDGQREIVNLRPEASATTFVSTLATGTLQSIPTAGFKLLKVVRNMSAASGGTGKRVVRLVDFDSLNTQEPDWHDPDVTGSAAHGSVVKNYAFDPDDPRNYYVYPGIKSGSNAYIEIVYSKSPTDLSSTSSTIAIDDIFGNALIDYTLFRSFQKDSEYAANAQRAGTHYQLFIASLSQGGQAKALANPNFDYKGTTTIGGASGQVPPPTA